MLVSQICFPTMANFSHWRIEHQQFIQFIEQKLLNFLWIKRTKQNLKIFDMLIFGCKCFEILFLFSKYFVKSLLLSLSIFWSFYYVESLEALQFYRKIFTGCLPKSPNDLHWKWSSWWNYEFFDEIHLSRGVGLGAPYNWVFFF